MELWDVYDINKRFTGKVIDRHSDERLKEGEYHLVVEAIIINSKGEILLNKRSKFKNKYPNMWESTAGSCIKGENSLQSMLREIREELGVIFNESDAVFYKTLRDDNAKDFKDIWDIFASEAKARFNLPTFPILNMFEIVANVRANYDIKEASALEQVKNNKTPILFIHGDADDFVPEYMCEELYEAANCKKDKLIIHDAGHTDSKYKEPETYYNKIFEFLGNI